jgi:hypothetical protein
VGIDDEALVSSLLRQDGDGTCVPRCKLIVLVKTSCLCFPANSKGIRVAIKMTSFTRIPEGEIASINVDVARRLSKIGTCSKTGRRTLLTI